MMFWTAYRLIRVCTLLSTACTGSIIQHRIMRKAGRRLLKTLFNVGWISAILYWVIVGMAV